MWYHHNNSRLSTKVDCTKYNSVVFHRLERMPFLPLEYLLLQNPCTDYHLSIGVFQQDKQLVRRLGTQPWPDNRRVHH